MEEQGGKNHHSLYMDKFRRLIAKTLTTPPPPPVFDTSPTLPLLLFGSTLTPPPPTPMSVIICFHDLPVRYCELKVCKERILAYNELCNRKQSSLSLSLSQKTQLPEIESTPNSWYQNLEVTTFYACHNLSIYQDIYIHNIYIYISYLGKNSKTTATKKLSLLIRRIFPLSLG